MFTTLVGIAVLGASVALRSTGDWPLVVSCVAAERRPVERRAGHPVVVDSCSAARAWTRVGGLVAPIALHERRARRPGQSRLRLLGSGTASVVGARSGWVAGRPVASRESAGS